MEEMHQLVRCIRVNHIVVVFSSLLGVNSQSNSDVYGNRTLADRTHPDALTLGLNCGGDASACEMHQGGANSVFIFTIRDPSPPVTDVTAKSRTHPGRSYHPPRETTRHQERLPLHPTHTPIMFALQFCTYTMHQSRSDPSAMLVR